MAFLKFNISEVPIKVIDKLKAIQNRFIWKRSTTKIKHSTLIADYENSGIRNADTPTKLKALKDVHRRQKLTTDFFQTF